MDLPRLDKTAISTVPLAEADADDLAYWLSRTPEERLRGLEICRRVFYGYGDPSPRLSRVLTVLERE